MADIFTKEKRSLVMSKIRSKNTKPELLVFKELRRRKMYFQKHYRGAVGTPDIALPKKKIAVFLDSDFWHGWQFPRWREKLPREYWREKIGKNRARDKRTFAKLRREGWKVLRVWDHDLKRAKREAAFERIAAFLDGRR